ncbi:protein-tyrosine phosphatase-like protein [Powellomyces hirtus]|nr:protein-tyrosine phosphatase-like protein [Powellomyces hirtus]
MGCAIKVLTGCVGFFRPSSESEKQPVLKVGNLFRSARLDDSTPQDVETLKNRYGIRTVIDLRSDLERKDCQHVSSTFLFPVIEQEMESELSPLKTNDDINPKPPIESSYSDTDESDADYFGPRNPPVDAASIGSITPGGGRRHRYSIEFAGHNFRRHGVWKPLGVWQKCKVVALIASGNKPRAVQMIGEEAIAPKGLIGLYHNFADYCGGEIVQALKLMAVPENFPVLVHCTQGKDRTGMVIAMALHCAGVSVEHIVTDFHRSQGGLDSQRDVMVQEMAKTGLDPSFSDAPANVLSDTIKYIIDKHGSVENYLSKHGFDKEWQDRLRDNLVEKRPVTRSK